MGEITVSEQPERGSYITYLYNTLSERMRRMRASASLEFNGERSLLRVSFGADVDRELFSLLHGRIAEVVAVGYKYEFLTKRVNVCLSRREKKLLCAALIAADLEGDKAFIRGKLVPAREYSIGGFYNFRLRTLREKWERIADYIPAGFGSDDLKRFCDFLVGESKNKIYVKDNTVFGENFAPLRLSRLLGEEDVMAEILLSDAGFVYCLGKVEESVGDFLQKYYAERAIFS